MAIKRAKDRDLAIPPPKNRANRERGLLDAEFFMRHYFANVFYEPLTEDRLDMIRSIDNAAIYGGDKAIAGPRGEGKTKTAIYAALRLALAGLSVFPIVIGKSQAKAQSELKTVKEKLQQSDLFRDDFPEIGYSFRAVGAWSSRARMQTVAGELTNIEIAPDHLILPTIKPWQLSWGNDYQLVSNEQIIASLGIDGPIRGTNFRDKRPTVAIIDDIEDREAAVSDVTIAKNEEVLEQDIGGLGASAEKIARVMLCTTQNRKCIAYKYTDAKQKPSWRGVRYRKMIKPPERMDLVEKYIAMRKDRTTEDPDARIAYQFWFDNREEIERGCVVSNVYSYSKKLYADGNPLEISAIQSYYNRVADVGMKAVLTEIDNDPPEDSTSDTLGLTWSMVAARNSGFVRGYVPSFAEHVTVGLDIGKRWSHWCKVAWWGNAIGVVVDYGIMETHGLGDKSSLRAIQSALMSALPDWRDTISQENAPDICLIDSGAYTDAVYEFCRNSGTPYFSSKGFAASKFKIGTQSDKRVLFDSTYAHYQEAEKIWLYCVNTEHWKQWLQQRFYTDTYGDAGEYNEGTLSLFEPEDSRTHHTYAHHQVAEEMRTYFDAEGKGEYQKFTPISQNNHWLDAMALACAGAGTLGVRLVPRVSMIAPIVAKIESTSKPAFTNQHGQPFVASQRI